MSHTKNEELELHRAVMDKDDLALAKIFGLYSDHLIACLKRWFPKPARQDEALVLEAVNEAFWGYYKNPVTFNPKKNTLERFLEIAADRDMRNILQREKKHFKKRNLPQDVELEEKFWNSVKKDEGSPDEQLIHNQSIEILHKELSNYFTNELDVRLAKLIIAGERETSTFSELLKIEELTIEKQRIEVKKHKDRIKKVLERNQIESKLKNLLQ